jgi:hypothetical protein
MSAALVDGEKAGHLWTRHDIAQGYDGKFQRLVQKAEAVGLLKRASIHEDAQERALVLDRLFNGGLKGILGDEFLREQLLGDSLEILEVFFHRHSS